MEIYHWLLFNYAFKRMGTKYCKSTHMMIKCLKTISHKMNCLLNFQLNRQSISFIIYLLLTSKTVITKSVYKNNR